jgi:hypothetical protein
MHGQMAYVLRLHKPFQNGIKTWRFSLAGSTYRYPSSSNENLVANQEEGLEELWKGEIALLQPQLPGKQLGEGATMVTFLSKSKNAGSVIIIENERQSIAAQYLGTCFLFLGGRDHDQVSRKRNSRRPMSSTLRDQVKFLGSDMCTEIDASRRWWLS